MERLLCLGILLITVVAKAYAQPVGQLNRENVPRNTVIAPTADARIEKNRNVVYCSSFEMSWYKLRDSIIKSPIQLSRPVEWVNSLNESNNKSVSKEFVCLGVGFARDSVQSKFQSQVFKKFSLNFKPKTSGSPFDICAYSYLNKKVHFFSELDESFSGEKLRFMGDKSVSFFGLKHPWRNPVYRSKLRIFDYRNPNDFIFQIETDNDFDEIYFAKVEPSKTLIETYLTVMKRVKEGHLEYMQDNDNIRIPHIDLNFENEFQDITGLKLLNKGFEKYTISDATQAINFSLNESGVSLESVSELRVLFAIPEPPVKNLVFDKPFLLVMKEKNQPQPYFLLWIGNSDLMRLVID